MSNKHKLSWLNRIKLCWNALLKGKVRPEDCKTIHEEEQWETCEQRRKHLEKSTRPRTYIGQKGKLDYTDYFERD